MTDREEAGLRHKVKICGTKQDNISTDRQWVVSTDETFTLQGRLLRQQHRNPDGSHWSLKFRFDNEGRLMEKEQSTGTPADRQLYSYGYDSLSRLDCILLHSANRNDHVFESIQYSVDGSRTSTCYPIKPEQTPGNCVSVCAESALHLSLDTAVIMTIFDSNDYQIRKVLYDSDDRVIRRIGFRYDGGGRLIEEGELVAGRIRDDFRNLYRYDAAGHEIEIDRRWGDMGGSRRTFVYNDRGDVLRERIEQNAGLIDDDIGPQDWTLRFAYAYDAHGNWTERRMETITQGNEPRLDRIEHRELTYY